MFEGNEEGKYAMSAAIAANDSSDGSSVFTDGPSDEKTDGTTVSVDKSFEGINGSWPKRIINGVCPSSETMTDDIMLGGRTVKGAAFGVIDTVDKTGGVDSATTEAHIPHFKSGRTLG